jgi:hypothetical protein
MDDGPPAKPGGIIWEGKAAPRDFRKKLTGTTFPFELGPSGKEDDGAGLFFFEQGGERSRRRVAAGERD